MLKKVLISSFVAAVVTVSGSLLHPYGGIEKIGNAQRLLSQAQIDSGTLDILQRACQNCHSEQTQWPWYNRVAPISWLIARDVQKARLHMNLSRWQDYSPDDRLRLLRAIGSAVRNDWMPLRRYTLLHPEARLTDKERQQIYLWTRIERKRLRTRQTRPISTAP